jgi:hypothetical protein
VVSETRLRRDAPCLPRHLAEAGYVTVASHLNVAAFWNRLHAYQRSGFQSYWSERDFDAHVATPLLVLNGHEGAVATGDLPIYRLPGLVLELLGDARPSPLTLTGVPPGLAIRPLPGIALVVSGDGPRCAAIAPGGLAGARLPGAACGACRAEPFTGPRGRSESGSAV